MNYVREIEKNGSLKETLKKIVKDIDKRLDNIENPSEDEEAEQTEG